jgi:hypothetical protein
VCVDLCIVFHWIVALFGVMCVICVFCHIVVPLPLGKYPFSLKMNNNMLQVMSQQNSTLVIFFICSTLDATQHRIIY